MARFIIAILLCFYLAPSNACDETCKKAQAEAKFNTKFPRFLTWKYCDRLKYDFMTVDIESLISYGSKHFQTKFKGPIKNIITMIEQRVFYDTKTTDNIFGKMANVKKELKAVLSGVTYSSIQGDETQKIVQEKFEALYDTVDTHKNLMHLKGKLVYK